MISKTATLSLSFFNFNQLICNLLNLNLFYISSTYFLTHLNQILSPEIYLTIYLIYHLTNCSTLSLGNTQGTSSLMNVVKLPITSEQIGVKVNWWCCLPRTWKSNISAYCFRTCYCPSIHVLYHFDNSLGCILYFSASWLPRQLTVYHMPPWKTL